MREKKPKFGISMARKALKGVQSGSCHCGSGCYIDDEGMEGKYLRELRAILETGRSEETAHRDYKKDWSSKPKSYGNCYVTARALHEVLGLETMHSVKEHQFWNGLPDGTEIDFTSDQSGGDGIHKLEGVVGKPKKFKPLWECRSINPRLKKYLEAVEEALSEFREKYSDVLAEK